MKRTGRGTFTRDVGVYLAASRALRDAVLEIEEIVRGAGASVVSTWHATPLAEDADATVPAVTADAIARENFRQMRFADVAIFIRDEQGRGRGYWVDMGFCHGVQTPVWLYGDGVQPIGGAPRIVERQQVYEECANRLVVSPNALRLALDDLVARYRAGKD